MTRILPSVIVITTLALIAIILFMHFSKSDAERVNPAPGTNLSATSSDIPNEYLSEYISAGEKYEIPWQLLAAIGKAESDHGRSPLPGVKSGVNSVGCCSGPMQICTTKDCGNVFKTYREDGNGDGKISVFHPSDSIHSAAKYLRWMTEVVGSSPRLLASGYNAGPTITAKRGVPPYPETQKYVRLVLSEMEKLR